MLGHSKMKLNILMGCWGKILANEKKEKRKKKKKKKKIYMEKER